MRFPVKVADETRWAKCCYVQQRKLTLQPLTKAEIFELTANEVSKESISALEQFRLSADPSLIDQIVFGLAYSRLQVYHTIQQWRTPDDNQVRLSDLGVEGGEHRRWFIRQLSRAFRVMIYEQDIVACETVEDVAILIAKKGSRVPKFVWELREWTRFSSNLKQADAGAYGRLACDKWAAACALGLVAGSESEFRQLIKIDGDAEVTALLLAVSEWDNTIIGMALFHRTWTGNIFLEYLSAHPTAIGSIKGIGVGILHYIALLALDLEATTLWMETSADSAPYYSHIFELGRSSDVEGLPRSTLAKFVATNGKLWRLLID